MHVQENSVISLIVNKVKCGFDMQSTETIIVFDNCIFVWYTLTVHDSPNDFLWMVNTVHFHVQMKMIFYHSGQEE